MMQPVLTIAGSDPSGGAGIQADLKTFSSLQVYGMAVITALTSQNTREVRDVLPTPPDFVASQLDAVLSDIAPEAVKTGMLATGSNVDVVLERLRAYSVKQLVVDPVLISSSGMPLLDQSGVAKMKDRLIPFCILVTPNLAEASVLTGIEVHDEASMQEAARCLHSMGARYVLVKGGHLVGDAVDLLFDGTGFERWASPRIKTRNLHGTGCVLSAAITACLATGKPMKEAVMRGKEFVTESIRRGFKLGDGVGPVNPVR